MRGGMQNDGRDLLGVSLEGLDDALLVAIKEHDVLVGATSQNDVIVRGVNVKRGDAGRADTVKTRKVVLLTEFLNFLCRSKTFGLGALLATLQGVNDIVITSLSIYNVRRTGLLSGSGSFQEHRREWHWKSLQHWQWSRRLAWYLMEPYII